MGNKMARRFSCMDRRLGRILYCVKKGYFAIIIPALLFLLTATVLFGMRIAFPRRERETVEGEDLPPSLVYAVMKAESNFHETAVSRVGAVGLMQLKPATAEFICRREGLPFEPERLKEGKYNAMLGCKYLHYLMGRFSCEETAIAAYNAGEGTVCTWLSDETCSEDGQTLYRIPYAETRGYVKKVRKFRKIYEFLYG